jgi:hypothetical protein
VLCFPYEVISTASPGIAVEKDGSTFSWLSFTRNNRFVLKKEAP